MFFPYERPSASLPGCGSPDAGVLSAALTATAASTAALTAPSSARTAPSPAHAVPVPCGVPALPSQRTPVDHSPARQGVLGQDGGAVYARYGAAELARRIGVDTVALREWEEQAGWIGGTAAGARAGGPGDPSDPSDAVDPTPYRAADVVRYETMARLVRRGVPVARAAALVRAAETLRPRTDPAAATLPKVNR